MRTSNNLEKNSESIGGTERVHNYLKWVLEIKEVRNYVQLYFSKHFIEQ